MLNPIAPPAFQGIDDASPYGYLDVAFDYVYNVVLTANQVLNAQVVVIFPEADFACRGITFVNTGLFSVQFQDGQGYYLSSGQVYSTNMPSTPGDPWPWFPEVIYPAGGKIYINITELSGATNTVQIVFRGVSRYKLELGQ